SQVPTRDQPREASQARPSRTDRQLISCTHGSQVVLHTATAPQLGRRSHVTGTPDAGGMSATPVFQGASLEPPGAAGAAPARIRGGMRWSAAGTQTAA